MPDDTLMKPPAFAASLHGIPSALDELHYRQIIREFQHIEMQGLRLRANATELARVVEHILEVMTHNAIAESRLRDLAAKELTAGEFAQFESEMDEVHTIFVQAQLQAETEGFRQVRASISGKPNDAAKQAREGNGKTLFKSALRAIGFVDIETKDQ